MQIVTEKGEYVTPIQMAQALINAEIQIDNPSGQLIRSIQKALTGKEPRDVIERQMFNTRELLELGDHLTAYAMAIEAMEKQIPKKPTSIDYKKYIDTVKNALYLKGAYWCPNCEHVVKCGTYCSDCGQAIDWSEKE